MTEENETELELDYDPQDTVDEFIDAIQQKNLQQAKNHFNNLINDRVFDSLESEKASLANSAYNGAEEEENIEMELEEPSEEEYTEEEEWDALSDEIDDALE
jgi:hypothetical protein|tara:strand:+ start:234 stop:539 length:306 start_codon:yes stop_codon:yes gene_type:complete